MRISHGLWLLMITATVVLLWFNVADARQPRTIRLNDQMVAPVYVKAGRTTVLSFPVKPSKVILGSSGAFAVEYIENDLAISPLLAGARSNLFVYLLGRRFAFNLLPAENNDEILIIRDVLDKQFPVRMKNE